MELYGMLIGKCETVYNVVVIIGAIYTHFVVIHNYYSDNSFLFKNVHFIIKLVIYTFKTHKYGINKYKYIQCVRTLSSG